MKRKSFRMSKKVDADEEENGAASEHSDAEQEEEEVVTATPKKKRASRGKKQEEQDSEDVAEEPKTKRRTKPPKKDSEPSEGSDEEETVEEEKKAPKKAKKTTKQNDKKQDDKAKSSSKKSKKDEKPEWDENKDFEVDRIIDVHFKKDGKREFLVLWKGYSQSESTWEPEENMNCKDLIKKFIEKLDKLKEVDDKELRVNRKQVHRYTLHPQAHRRRMSRRFQGKERVQYLETE